MLIETILVLVALIAMGLSLFLIVVPVVPVSALEWAIGMVFILLDVVITGESRISLLAGILMTVFMVLGATSQFWMPLFGLRGGGLSCGGLIGFFIGMVVGSILIPVPFVGTIVGGIVAVFLVEYARIQETRRAVQSSKTALKAVLYSMIAEFLFAAAIVGVFIISIITTQSAV